MVCAHLDVLTSTWTKMTHCVGWAALISLMVFCITTSAHDWLRLSTTVGDMRAFQCVLTQSCTICSTQTSCGGFQLKTQHEGVLPTIHRATTSSFSNGQGAFAQALDEGVCVTQGPRENSSGKLVGEIGTVSCVSAYSHLVDVPQIYLCESNESLLHIFEPENLTQLRTGDTRTARGAPGNVLCVGDSEPTFSRQPGGVVSGTQPVGKSLPGSAPKVDSEYGVNGCTDSADERRCVVSCRSDCSIEEGPVVWTETNDSWTNDGDPTGEPQACANLSLGSSVVWDCDETLCSRTGHSVLPFGLCGQRHVLHCFQGPRSSMCIGWEVFQVRGAGWH